MNRVQSFNRHSKVIILIIAFIQMISIASAANLTLSSDPLFIGNSTTPNMLIILDNSASTNQDILAKAHWERAAYESNYAFGDYRRLDGDVGQLDCLNRDDDCGILRNDGAITLSGPPDLRNRQHSDYDATVNYVNYLYLSSCSASWSPCGTVDNTRDLTFDIGGYTSCHGPNFSLADCPETEALDWRVRSAALNVLYYDPNTDYKPWKLSKLNLQDANFNAALGNPYPNQIGSDRSVNLGSDAPLGIDPTSCKSDRTANPPKICKASNFSKGFVYYVWVDDKGYDSLPNGSCPQTKDRPHRGICINMTDGPNGMVDLWDTHYKVTVTATSRKVEKMVCDGTYNTDGSLKCVKGNATQDLPGNIIARPLTPAEERKNIANWFQYYHRRLYTFKALLSNTVYTNPEFRYGLMSVGSNVSNLIVANDNDLTQLQNLGGTNPQAQELIFEFPVMIQQDSTIKSIDLQQHNLNMLDAFFKLSYFSDTPMRETLDRAGQYYLYTGSNGSTLVPGTRVDPLLTTVEVENSTPRLVANNCQRNYSLIITDGYYTIPSTSSFGFADVDNDGSSVTLADVARYYYKTNLRPSANKKILGPTRCDNRTPPNGNNDNEQYFPTHLHMVTFGISVGVDGNLAWGNEGNTANPQADGWPDSIVTNPIKCPPPSGYVNDWGEINNSAWANQPQSCTPNDCPQKIDDLWHAAYNSHGAYISVKTPKEMEDALRNMIRLVSIDKSFSTSASSSSYYTSGSKVFLTSFDSQFWTGDLIAYKVDATGNLNIDPQGNPISIWSAADQLRNTDWDTQRTILSYDPVNQAIPFRNGKMSSTALNSDQVKFLRGKNDDAFIDSTNFRRRLSILGDIIQSDPVYVAQPYFRYDEYKCIIDQIDNFDECPAYSSFKSTSRTAMVYVGANDGMLHGFEADTGKEKIAYIPGRLIDKLGALTSRDYTHKFYVDGSTTVGDAYFAGAWHTVLVGSLRAGGQAIFALDITNPANFSENDPRATVLWEFSDRDTADLGYTFSKPVIARLHNGKWAAIFGNGYNNTEEDGRVSQNGEAVLYVVYLDKSESPWFIRIPTGAGKTADPTTNDSARQRPNGLATPAVVDVDDKLTADYVYAGDLFGNLWKFDIRDPDPSRWQPAIKLFTATATNGIAQPITVRPIVDVHPMGKAWGNMIYFGTGKYFEVGDNLYSSATQQSFYGIWDKNVSSSDDAFDRTSTIDNKPVLFQQTISTAGTKYRTTSATQSAGIKWLDSNGNQYNKGWYMDFPLGEKQVTNPTIFNQKVIFTTLVLPAQPKSCDSDGSTSWLMVVNTSDGGIPSEGAFTSDSVSDNTVVGIISEVGALPKPSLIIAGNGLSAVARGTEGGYARYSINPGIYDIGRQSSWRQLWRQ